MADEHSLDEARQRVRRFLRTSFGDAVHDDGDELEVRHHGVRTQMFVLPWRRRIGVVALSISNEGMRVDDGLTRLLASEAHRLPFGQFELVAAGTAVRVAHDLLEPQLTRSELEAVVDSVARAAAHYGPIVQEWFGGHCPATVAEGTTPPALSEAGNDADSKSVDLLRYRVRGHVEDLDYRHAFDDQGDFVVEVPGSAAPAWVRPTPWTRGRTLVRMWSVTNEGMRVDGELTRFLLETNEDLPFGGFRLDRHGPQTLVAYSLLGETLAQPALENALRCLTVTADKRGPLIEERFGGRLFSTP